MTGAIYEWEGGWLEGRRVRREKEERRRKEELEEVREPVRGTGNNSITITES